MSSLLNYDLFTIVDIESLLGGLTIEFTTVHVIPAVKVELTCLCVERAYTCGLSATAQKTYRDILRLLIS